MLTIIIFVINVFIVLMIINEHILVGKISKWKYYYQSLNLVISFVVIFVIEFIFSENSYYIGYLIFTVVNLGFFAYQIVVIYLASTNKKNYNSLFIKTLKETKKFVFLVVDEQMKVKELSSSLIEDVDLTLSQIIGRKWIDVVQHSLKIQTINGVKVNNTGYEQHLSQLKSTYDSLLKEYHEYQYKNVLDEQQILNCVIKPIVVNHSFKGFILFGEKVTAPFLLNADKENKELKNEIKDLQKKFVSTLELSKEGLYYLDEKSLTMWGTDSFKKIVGIETNTIHQDDFIKLIHSLDVEQYKKQIAMRHHRAKYKVHYRVIVKKHDKWVLEEGQTIQTINGAVTVANVSEVESRINKQKLYFLDYNDYKSNIQHHIINKEKFWLLRFNLKFCTEYYAKFGRDITNNAINTFLKKIKSTYDARTNKMYELASMEYAIIFTEAKEFQVVRKGLLASIDLFKQESNVGGVKLSFAPKIGIIAYPENEDDYEKLLKGVEKAVYIAESKVSKYHYCFYEDIHDF